MSGCHTGPMTSCFRVSGRNFLHVFYLGFEHSILSRLALIFNPTVVPVMWNIYDGIGRFQTASCMRDDNDAEQECAANSTLRHDRYCIDRTAPGE